MSTIYELSEELANKIAAGEVIERPASVVKELVENSIDAHATQIEVAVEDAGMKSISIIDNGDGIAEDDVELAFHRNATSKIQSTKDLFNISTLGFRGEALASIVSVAKVELLTSTDGATATKVNYEGNNLISRQTSARPKGTTIVVENLFFNTPARLKYMKSQNTELNKIVDIINRLSLGHPEIAFTLKNNGKNLVRTSGNDNFEQAIAGIYGRTIATKLVKFEAENLDYQVTGYTSLPELTRANRNYISVILNGRFIKNYNLTRAIISGYGSKLMIGRFPVTVLSIKMDPILVDVNVHPTKQEVRLSKENELANLVSGAIDKAISSLNLIPDAMENLQKTRNTTPKAEAMPIDLSYQKESAPEINEVQETEAKITSDVEIPVTEAVDTKPIFDNPERLKKWDERLKEEMNNDSENEYRKFPQLLYIGQAHGTYLIAESDDGIYLIDQHAAQERVNYEKYRKEIGEVKRDQQKLLVPIVLDYPNSDSLLINDKIELFEELGLYLQNFGQNSYMIQSHPTWFKKGQEEDTTRELIDYVLNDKNISIAKFREQAAIMMSCKRAIKANHHLDEQQGRELLKRLAEVKNPFNCPHGRPVLVQFTQKDLEKMFKRIQDSHESRNL
ncbi:DNA mismatch repair protein MutL [Companilactobacillus sp. RD055328]|uniref:DNA mismatch repair endonuclease MutL n=1 Tax=Companilactobacillus sp. RD055328 TaxID=2916634 RepID=UPI001FC8B571|nr:DNA mismatch repair endonuclease MutL [Companilactobacillus sp. RD055328]GKQ42122.1 DNA mismatch repair protein MutL [Companilactobacillus sp. RD055328]